MTSPVHPLHRIQRIVIVTNGQSTSATKARAFIAKTQKTLADKTFATVEAGGQTADGVRKRLIAKLKAGGDTKQLIIAAGGDGTVHNIMSALMHANMPSRYRHTPFAAWPLGNANDFFNSTHDAKKADDPVSILLGPDVELQKVYPLEWRFEPTEGTTWEEYSLCYGSVGASAEATQIIGEPEHRELRKKLKKPAMTLIEAAKVSSALWRTSPFDVRINNETKKVVELQFMNSPVAAMILRYNIALKERAMLFAIYKAPRDMFSAAARHRKALPGEKTDKTVTFTLLDAGPYMAQLDGECFEIGPGHVSVTPSKNYVVVWATKS